jgi:hypothetical protein
MKILLETADTENVSPIKYFGVGESGVFITNHDSTKCMRNFATGALENTIGGTVALTDHIASFTSQSNFVQTAIAETALMSIFSVFCPKTALSFAATNYTSTGNMGVGLWAQSAGQLQFFASRDNGAGAPALSTASGDTITFGNWVLASGVASATGNTVTNHTTNKSTTLATTAARMLQANPVRLGSSWGGSFVGSADHLITVIVPGVLTAVQTASLLAAMRAYATKHGITV